jgi:hypothetical protein
MSTLKTNNVQVGQSVTATNNFTLYQPSSPDGTVRLGVGNSGATTADVITVSSTTVNVAANLQQNGVATSRLVQAAAQASTSGSSISFTGIPSWVKKITVMFSGVSVNASATVYIRLGTSSGATTSGYLGAAFYINAGNANQASTYWPVDGTSTGAASLRHGVYTIANVTGNTWAMSGGTSNSNDTGTSVTNGSIPLAATLDRVLIEPSSGAFDAGTINILYEG